MRIVIHQCVKAQQQLRSSTLQLSAVTIPCSLLQLKTEALFTPEIYPFVLPAIVLVRGSYGVVALPAKAFRTAAMQPGE